MKSAKSLAAWNEPLLGLGKNPDLDAIRKLCIKAATLAPSTHNSQPWQITEDGDTVTVSERSAARLTHSDPNMQYYWISIGAFVQNFDECAQFYGWSVDLDIDNKTVVNLKLTRSSKDKNDSLLEQVHRRYSEKRIFKSGAINQNVLEELGVEPQVIITNDKNKISSCASAYFEAAKSYRSHADFALELREWMHTNRRKTEGMHHRSSGLSRVKAVMGRAALKRTPKFLAVMAKKYLKLVASSSAVGFITSSGLSPAELLDSGRRLERLSLLATKYELSLTPLAAIVEREQSVKELIGIFEYTGKDRPVIFFRISDRKEPVHHTPRNHYEG